MPIIDIDLLKSIPEIVRAFNETVRTANDLYVSYRERASAARVEDADMMVVAADTVMALVNGHVDAIRLANEPLVRSRDLRTTSLLIGRLVASHFPASYGEIFGTLDQWRKLPKFKEQGKLIGDLLHEMTNFIQIAFIQPFDSVLVAKQFDSVEELIRLSEAPDAAAAATQRRITDLRLELQKDTAWWQLRALYGHDYPPETETQEPETSAAKVELLRAWASAWSENVQRVAYKPRGVFLVAGQLKGSVGRPPTAGATPAKPQTK